MKIPYFLESTTHELTDLNVKTVCDSLGITLLNLNNITSLVFFTSVRFDHIQSNALLAEEQYFDDPSMFEHFKYSFFALKKTYSDPNLKLQKAPFVTFNKTNLILFSNTTESLNPSLEMNTNIINIIKKNIKWNKTDIDFYTGEHLKLFSDFSVIESVSKIEFILEPFLKNVELWIVDSYDVVNNKKHNNIFYSQMQLEQNLISLK